MAARTADDLAGKWAVRLAAVTAESTAAKMGDCWVDWKVVYWAGKRVAHWAGY